MLTKHEHLDMYKVVFIGSYAVGKTSIIRRFTHDDSGEERDLGIPSPASSFSDRVESTVGADFVLHSLELRRSDVEKDSSPGKQRDTNEIQQHQDPFLECLLYVWDTAGMERFRALLPLYFRGASCVVCVYDVSDADSFEQVKKLSRRVFRDGLAESTRLSASATDIDDSTTTSKPEFDSDDSDTDDDDDDDSEEEEGEVADVRHRHRRRRRNQKPKRMSGGAGAGGRPPKVGVPIIVIVGNKIDLGPGMRSVSREQGEELARTFEEDERCPCAFFFETSAKEGANIRELFYRVAVECVKYNVVQAGQISRLLGDAQSTGRGRCCFGS